MSEHSPVDTQNQGKLPVLVDKEIDWERTNSCADANNIFLTNEIQPIRSYHSYSATGPRRDRSHR